MAGSVGKVLCVHFSLSSPSGTLCVSGQSNQTSWDREQEVSMLSRLLLAMLMLFHHLMSVCPNRDKRVPLWRSDIAFTYDFYYLSLSLYLPLPSNPYFPDTTPLVHVAEHSYMLVKERSVFSLLLFILGDHVWTILLKNERTLSKMHFPQVQHWSISVSHHLLQQQERICTTATSLCVYYTDVSRMFLFVQIAILLLH